MDGGNIPLRQGKADFDVGQVLHLVRKEHILGYTVVRGVKGPLPIQPLVQGGGADAAHLTARQAGFGELPHLEDLSKEGLRRHLGVVLPHHAENAAVDIVIMDGHVSFRHRNVLGGTRAAGGDGEIYRLLFRQLTGAAGEKPVDIALIISVAGEGDPVLKLLHDMDVGEPIAHPIFC